MQFVKKLRRAHNQPCHHCERRMDFYEQNGVHNLRPTRDHHPVPRARGGRLIVIACAKCNNMKGDMDAHDWAAFMAANPQWWLLQSKADRRAARKQHRNRIRQATIAVYSTGEPVTSTALADALEQIKGRPSRIVDGRQNGIPYRIFTVPKSPREIMRDALRHSCHGGNETQ